LNYQKLVCWGDSQTFGARTYGCYPLYLVRSLNETTRYTWTASNLSRNGDTARDLWFRVTEEAGRLEDTYHACILIGTNDVANGTPLDLFTEYYGQIVSTLEINHIRNIYCGEIPQIHPDGHAFFPHSIVDDIGLYNNSIEAIVRSSSRASIVRFGEMDLSMFVDPVHLSEKGNAVLAAAFAKAIKER
jgi:lysophospholipase L1-like esterase